MPRADALGLQPFLLDYLPIKQAPLSSLDAFVAREFFQKIGTRRGFGTFGCSFDK
jgi:hypothetical protein